MRRREHTNYFSPISNICLILPRPQFVIHSEALGGCCLLLLSRRICESETKHTENTWAEGSVFLPIFQLLVSIFFKGTGLSCCLLTSPDPPSYFSKEGWAVKYPGCLHVSCSSLPHSQHAYLLWFLLLASPSMARQSSNRESDDGYFIPGDLSKLCQLLQAWSCRIGSIFAWRWRRGHGGIALFPTLPHSASFSLMEEVEKSKRETRWWFSTLGSHQTLMRQILGEPEASRGAGILLSFSSQPDPLSYPSNPL